MHDSGIPASLRPPSGEHPRSGSGKVEEEICVLDSGAAPGGSGGSQGPLGRTGCDSSPGFFGEGGAETANEGVNGRVGEQTELNASSIDGIGFYISTSLDEAPADEHDHNATGLLYDHDPNAILGAAHLDGIDTPEEDADRSRCFNCGSPAHILSACPSPLDHALIALSRQYHIFLRQPAARALYHLGSLRAAQEWQDRRLAWVDAFAPGEVRGSLLRDALGLDEGDAGVRLEWLERIAEWGYPRGWAGTRDPRELMRERVLLDRADEEDSTDEEEELIIFGDDDEPEHVRLQHPADSSCRRQPESTSSPHPPSTGARSRSYTPGVHPLQRWAAYPSTYFSPTFLTLYTGRPLSATLASAPAG